MARSSNPIVGIKRVYDASSKGDGRRVLVDRPWPRGLSKEVAAVDIWMKDIAPSNDLRKWFGHDPERWPEFRRRYKKELTRQDQLVAELTRLAQSAKVTLLFGAKDEKRNQAVVLLDVLKKALARE